MQFCLTFSWAIAVREQRKKWTEKPVQELTGGLCASQGQTVLAIADSIHMNQILCLGCQSGQSEVVPAWGQPLILGPSAARFLVADAVAGDDRSRSQPVNGEGVGADVREVQASRGVQSWREKDWRLGDMLKYTHSYQNFKQFVGCWLGVIIIP